MNQKYCLVYSTWPKDNHSSEIMAKELILLKLAACVNIIDKITSIYSWNNTIAVSPENLLIIKTKFSLLEPLKTKILTTHPYKCPEIVVTPIIAGSNDYLNWLESNLIK